MYRQLLFYMAQRQFCGWRVAFTSSAGIDEYPYKNITFDP